MVDLPPQIPSAPLQTCHSEPTNIPRSPKRLDQKIAISACILLVHIHRRVQDRGLVVGICAIDQAEYLSNLLPGLRCGKIVEVTFEGGRDVVVQPGGNRRGADKSVYDVGQICSGAMVVVHVSIGKVERACNMI